MKLKQWLQVILVGSSILVLASCSTKHAKGSDAGAIYGANSAYGNKGAHAAGLGNDSQFGEANGAQLASKNTYYFDYDKYEVHEQDKPAIAAKSQHLVSNPKNKVMLEGHTDPRGSREYNIGLGERRAQAVADLMKEKGVNPDQVHIVSYGAQKLASNGHSEKDYQLDRRAIINQSN
jgi:peptidoglycan-associated lipoprotein